MEYKIKKEVEYDFETAIKKTKEELKKEGFGILTRIDIDEKLKEKIGVDFEKYTILGACNPPYAHKALLAEYDIGLQLPCNVVVYNKNGKTVVSAIRPKAVMEGIGNEELTKIADEIEEKLIKVISQL